MKKLLTMIFVVAVIALTAAQAYAFDTDADGIDDANDNCLTVKNGNCSQNLLNCDIDGDGTVTPEEELGGYQKNWNKDADKIGDACQDYDGDGIMDYLDNCPGVDNPSQNADACSDKDNDLIADAKDNCIDTPNPQQEDRDLDGVGDFCDNCRLVANPDQLDSNDDNFGDACTEDEDADQIPNKDDNCPLLFNPGQEDGDNDGVGDACDAPVDTSASPAPVTTAPVALNHNSSCSLMAGAMASADAYGISALILMTSGLILALRRKAK